VSINSVLVTGSSGTLGTALCERLMHEEYTVYGTDLVGNPWNDAIDERTTVIDLCDETELSRLPTEVDMIVHLSAHARVHRLVQRPQLAMENLEMTFNLLDFARRHDVPNVVFSSSREVYGNTEQVVYDETATHTDSCESPYTASKIGGEALVDSFNTCYGLSTSVLRFSNVYGRYDISDRVVPLFIAKSCNGESLTVFGNKKVLDFTYLDDCVDGIYRVIDQYPKAKETTFNIASGRGYSLLELAEIVNEHTPGSSDITVQSSRIGEVDRYIADISKAKRMLDFRPKYSLSDGIAETINWYTDRPSVLEDITASQNAR